MAQQVKNPPATWEAWILSLDWEDALEKRMATHSSILAWRIPCIVHRVAKSRTCLSDFHFHFILNFGRFDYSVSWYVPPWVSLVWDSLCLLPGLG